MKKLLLLITGLLLLFSVDGQILRYGNYVAPIPSTILVNSIDVWGTGGATTITSDGGTLQMLKKTLPTNAADTTVTWSRTNGTGTANISAGGLLTALTNGTVTARATANDGSAVYGEEEITISNQAAANMVTNGTFSTADYWTLGHSNSGQGLSITEGHLAFTDLVANDDSYADQAQTDMVTGLESGVDYTLEFDITMVGTGLSLVRFYTNGGGAGITPYGVERGTGHYSINFTAPTISTGGLHIGNFANGTQGWYIDNVVVYLQE